MSDYDAIVIGAGNAGLTAAATLQRAGVRTLLVERHNVPGGCATSFRRGRFEFEVALHQLSGIGGEGQAHSLRTLLDELDVAQRLEFVQEHDLYRVLVPRVLDVTLPADWDAAVDLLEDVFPGNRDRVRRFLDLARAVTIAGMTAARATTVAEIDPVWFRYSLRPTQQVLDEYFDDEGIKAALGMYWMYLGQPPSKLPFQELATVLFIYLEFKPWHVRGGSQAMSAAILDSFRHAGGEVRFNTTVRRILTRQGAVVGVRLDDGQEISATDVVSNASLPTTYAMLDRAAVPTAVRADLATRRVGVSGFGLHMGLDATPAELGFTTSTNFVNLDTDADRVYCATHSLEPARGICVSCYDVRIGFAPPGACHVSLMALQYADAWATVAPRDYARTKFAYANTLLDAVEHLTPGIRDAIEEVDVATPLTITRYLGHPGGAIYGYDQDATEGWQFRDSERNTGVPGLYLAGAWTGGGGFHPTLQAGARVGRRLLHAKAA